MNILRYTLFGFKEKSVHAKLKSYMAVSNAVFALGFFGAIFYVKLGLRQYIGDHVIGAEDIITLQAAEKLPRLVYGVRDLLRDKWADVLFSAFVVLWYFAYKTAVTRETDLLVTFYSHDRAPRNWEKISGANWVSFTALGITVAFILLAACIDNIVLFIAVMQFLLCLDAFGNGTLRRNILAHYYAPEFEPEPDDPLRERILARRQVALEYWVWRPQLSRIGLMMCATSAILALWILDEQKSIAVPDPALKFAIMAIIIANETTMQYWRFIRDGKLHEIEARS